MARLHRIFVTFVLVTPSTLSAVTIDDFSVGPLDIVSPLGAPPIHVSQTDLDQAHVISGIRSFGMNVIAGPGGGGDGNVRVTIDPARSVFEYHADFDLTAANFALVYGDLDDDTPFDLTADDANAIVVDFASADFDESSGLGLGGLLYVIVESGVGQQATYSGIGTIVEDSTLPFSLVFPFRQFARRAPNADFSQVTRVSLNAPNGYLFGDFTLTGIRTDFFQDGDFNFDGLVNDLDYALWRARYGTPLGSFDPEPTDANLDGSVDAADYVIWRNSISASLAAARTSLTGPEPPAFVLSVMALQSLAAFTLRRARRISTKS